MQTLEELKSAQQQLNAIEKQVLDDITAKAQLLGYSLVKAENSPQPPPPRKECKTYRNPDNPEEIYRGKGKRPTWLQTKLEQGANLNDFAV